MFRNQIVGLIRFSLVTTGSFYPGFDSVEAMSKFLFDPGRLERRFRMFEALCLPALKRQTDGDFTCVVLTGTGLPKQWADRLNDLVSAEPWARIVALDPIDHYKAIRQAFAGVPSDGFTHRTSFRLDDDDAIDLGHIGRLRALAERVQPVAPDGGPVALGFNRGIYLQFDKPANVLFEASERTPLSVGAALVAPVGYADNIYLRNHRALAQFFNTWLDAETFVYLRTLHQDNKSNPHFSGSQGKPDSPDLNKVLRTSFGFEPGMLRSLRP